MIPQSVRTPLIEQLAEALRDWREPDKIQSMPEHPTLKLGETISAILDFFNPDDYEQNAESHPLLFEIMTRLANVNRSWAASDSGWLDGATEKKLDCLLAPMLHAAVEDGSWLTDERSFIEPTKQPERDSDESDRPAHDEMSHPVSIWSREFRFVKKEPEIELQSLLSSHLFAICPCVHPTATLVNTDGAKIPMGPYFDSRIRRKLLPTVNDDLLVFELVEKKKWRIRLFRKQDEHREFDFFQADTSKDSNTYYKGCNQKAGTLLNAIAKQVGNLENKGPTKVKYARTAGAIVRFLAIANRESAISFQRDDEDIVIRFNVPVLILGKALDAVPAYARKAQGA